MTQNIFSFFKKREVKQFIKFFLIGGIGTSINLLILYLLTEFAGFYYMLSAIIAFMVGATINFIINKRWTFLERIREDFLIKYSKYFFISIVALLGNLLILYILTEFAGFYYVISQFLAASVSFLVNFFGSKKWIFKTKYNKL